MSGVTFDRGSKNYADGTRPVNALNLDIQDGEFMVLVGPSGCGKTTALGMVAGLEEISEGMLRIGERLGKHVPARDRDIAMVFQSYALYPHLTVYENIAFGLRLRGTDKKAIDRRVRDAARGRAPPPARPRALEECRPRTPRALGGGRRRRGGRGPPIAREPQTYLMD